MKRYSEMDQEELFREMQTLLGEARKKEQAGFFSEANVLEQKYYMAKSYTLNKEHIQIGQEYQVDGESGLFKVAYLNGVFAWGRFAYSEEDEAFPIGRLVLSERNN